MSDKVIVLAEQFNFIAAMENKYDYTSYIAFCEEKGFSVTPFHIFAHIVMNGTPKTITRTVPDQSAPRSCCGGGNVK